MAGLLGDILGFIDRSKQAAKANLGLLFSDPKEYLATMEGQAKDFNRLQSLAVQGDINAKKGLPVTNEQLAARQYVDRVTNDVAMGFAGTVTPGSSWIGKNLPNVEKLAKNKDKFLYHSDVAKNVKNLQYGIDPQQGGSWIKEIAQGATDDVEGLLANQTPMAWFSDKPEWVKIKVARELNKPLDKVTIDDIKNFGHLAIINKKDPYLTDIWRVGETGLAEGGQSKVQTLKGEKIPAWQTNLYQEGNYGQRMEPFGVERNEWVSTQSVDPFVQLTGDNLVKYLKLTGLLDK
jgi:hypothetical protein